MIDIESLGFRYPGAEFALSIPRFHVNHGEKVAVIGPSGSGKTTLLSLVAGIRVPQQGRVRSAGVEISALNDRARREFRIGNVGLVFQEFELLDYLDVLDNILLPYRISRALRLTREVRERAAELARRLAIGDKLRRGIDQLSQGERQRVCICRALLPWPKLVLADEATGNLDPHNKEHILELLFDAVDAHDATLLAVTHDHELLPHFDRVIDFADFRAETT
ncbi:MAG: ABC transporter ATP-binding protein [Gammaproteobacteria bacterium]|nr:ABC transporter ATP-binding protein [Gammaproteobacteria bacterium]NIX06431.1 ATP-binding cassette domain-containing protein [Gammaproteobacteria bacterium]